MSLAANTAVGLLGCGKQGAPLPVAALDVEVAFADVVLALDDAESGELVAIPLKPVPTGRELWRPGDGRNPPVPEPVQVTDCEPRTGDVVRGDVAHALAGDVEVDCDSRDAALEQSGELRLTAVDAHQDQAVDPVVERAPEEFLRSIGGEDEQVVAELARGVLQPRQHVLEERVADVGMVGARVQHDPQNLGAAGDERARGRTGDVLERGRLREHAFTCLVAHLRRAVENARDGRNGHAASSRYLADVRDLPTSSVAPDCRAGLGRGGSRRPARGVLRTSISRGAAGSRAERAAAPVAGTRLRPAGRRSPTPDRSSSRRSRGCRSRPTRRGP